MDTRTEDTPEALPEFSRSLSISTKALAQSALEANKRLQHTLAARAEELETELVELDSLLVSEASP